MWGDNQKLRLEKGDCCYINTSAVEEAKEQNFKGECTRPEIGMVLGVFVDDDEGTPRRV